MANIAVLVGHPNIDQQIIILVAMIISTTVIIFNHKVPIPARDISITTLILHGQHAAAAVPGQLLQSARISARERIKKGIYGSQ